MESYEELRLSDNDKVQKVGFWERFKKEKAQGEERGDSADSSDSTNSPQIPQVSQNPLEESPQNADFQTDFPNNFQATFHSQSPESQNPAEQPTSLNTQEKEELFEMDLNAKEIPFKVVCATLGVMLFVLLLFVPKIYIRNDIYYTSRNIVQLQAQLDSLNEENKQIKKQLEDIKFRNLTHELDF